VLGLAGRERHLPCSAERGGLIGWLGGQLTCPLEVALRLGRGTERGRSLAGLEQCLVGFAAEPFGVGCVGVEPVGVEQVGGDHLGHLVLAEGGREVLGGCEVLLAPVSLWQGLVGDVAEQVLEERVLALLGRARIGLQPQHFPPHHGGEERLQPVVLETAQRRDLEELQRCRFESAEAAAHCGFA